MKEDYKMYGIKFIDFDKERQSNEKSIVKLLFETNQNLWLSYLQELEEVQRVDAQKDPDRFFSYKTIENLQYLIKGSADNCNQFNEEDITVLLKIANRAKSANRILIASECYAIITTLIKFNEMIYWKSFMNEIFE